MYHTCQISAHFISMLALLECESSKLELPMPKPAQIHLNMSPACDDIHRDWAAGTLWKSDIRVISRVLVEHTCETAYVICIYIYYMYIHQYNEHVNILYIDPMIQPPNNSNTYPDLGNSGKPNRAVSGVLSQGVGEKWRSTVGTCMFNQWIAGSYVLPYENIWKNCLLENLGYVYLEKAQASILITNNPPHWF